MNNSARFEFHVSRESRDRYGFADTLFSLTGNVVFANLAASREFAERMNQMREAKLHPERAAHPGALNAMGLIDEALHVVVALYREQRDSRALIDALAWFEARLGSHPLDRALLAFAQQFPTVAVYRGEQSAAQWLAESTGGVPHRAIALEELMMLWLANLNPAFRPFAELFKDDSLAASTVYPQLTSALREYFETRPRFGPEDQNLVDMLRAPALASPHSMAGQLAFMRVRWAALLGDFFHRLLTALDVLKEEEIAVWMRFHPPGLHFGGPPALGDSSAAAIPSFRGPGYEYERFSPDVEWMPNAVLIAKSVYVWLHQLSVTYGRPVRTLDQVPDEELGTLARRGFNALWLIGVWERSRASQRIKQMTGNPEAAASAYSLYDYVVAEDLGGEAAYINLRNRAWARGIRLASDMVPNHMGIDSRWVIEHPDWFLSLPHSPFPAYTFNGPDVSSDSRVEIKIEDHYYDRTDAAVVFRRVDRWTGDTRYIYHGNDGTSFPWNDTAQLNYLKPEVREAVIQTILHVARLFPIIRFDAAMTLTKQHYQRLWFPAPGTGGAIPSRAEHGLTKEAFDAAMPAEFWRELVDRVAAEVPGTLLLAEAFWLLEGYFVRTLGMHRVYNSAFMNMLRDEENANYRSVLKNTLEFDPEVLKRYVNFMNNPDERTAVDQFGKGDKYFGVCTMLATLPGLPMFGHGQIEGFTERYGMEYRRAYHDESADPWLVARHEREISPLLHRRALFAEVHNFLLYDFFTEQGLVNEDVFAYSNRWDNHRALVIYHNRYADTRGWIRASCAYSEKTPDGGKRLCQRTLGEGLGLSGDPAMFLAYRDAFTGLEYLHRASDIAGKGLYVELGAYKCSVFVDWIDLREDATRPWGQLCEMLGGRGVSSLEDALHALKLKPVHDTLRTLLDPTLAAAMAEYAAEPDTLEHEAETPELLDRVGQRLPLLLEQAQHFLSTEEGKVAKDGGPVQSALVAGDMEATVEHAKQCLKAALRVPLLERYFSAPWPEEARAVLPTTTALLPDAIAIWSTILGWCAVDALGRFFSPAEPEPGVPGKPGVGLQGWESGVPGKPGVGLQGWESTAAVLFDRLRLREPMAESFAVLGFRDEEPWRAAARVRAAFAHPGLAGTLAEPSPGRPLAAPFGWLHDPDVAWLVGVHEYQGLRYLVKESYERLLWWMALRRLLAIAQAPKPGVPSKPGVGLLGWEPDPKAIEALEHRLRARVRAAAETGYRVEALFESGEGAEN